MAKLKTSFFCQNCGAQSSKWVGKCNSCGDWNTMVEEVVQREEKPYAPSSAKSTQRASKPQKITQISFEQEARVVTKDDELNRVLGGGIVPGSLVLIGGEPGIGKSTLLLQVALSLSDYKVLYISGEESEQQIKMRSDRMKYASENCYLLTETSTQNIFKQVELLEPHILIIDSIQTLHTPHVESAAGSVSQIRECAAQLMKFAKEADIPVFLIGHITKEGAIAGPKILEHMVDTVLQFEGDRNLAYRILRATKNRFGPASELGIYEMGESGLRIVKNPSEILLSQRENALSGITTGAMLEGNRPLLIEVQSLVSPATYGTPQRSSTGFDNKRLNMLLAVLEKRGGMRLGVQDVFLNIAGGLKVEDPALDLPVCISIASSFEDVQIGHNICFAGEVGLGGEVRAINRIENRIREAGKLGFREIIISSYNLKGLKIEHFDIQISAFSHLYEVIHHLGIASE